MKSKSIIRKILRILVLAYLGLIVFVYFTQENIIFFPSSLPQDFVFKFKGNFSEQFVQSGDDKIHSLVFKVPNSKGLIIYFHGNAGAMDSWGEVASELSGKYGWDVWMIDYPGYGKSSGKIHSQDQLLKMADDIFSKVKTEYSSAKIVLYGRSVGSGIAVNLASRQMVAGLILESPYTSLTDMAENTFPLLPTFILKYPMPSKDWIKKIKISILMIHGTDDEVVPFKQGKELSKMAADATFVEIRGGHHNDLSMFPAFDQALQQYLGSF